MQANIKALAGGRGDLPELLSPCGSKEAAIAAVEAGADAVYLGGRRFNARMNAKNFSDDELKGTIEYCHARGVKVYVTLNTVLYDRELPEALAYAGMLYEIGADAVICADMGLIRLLRERLPELPVHVSTQTAVHNLPALELLAELGVKRVVVARELSRAQLKELCASSPVEIEMFVHGALCVSCSGQCLLSAVMGGRSGNRGECAQPCRLPYEPIASSKQPKSKSGKEYPISLRDLLLAVHIPEILELGVSSLKIEGRMKSPSYVATVTSIYRRLLDERRSATVAETEALRRIFSRSGFTDAYFTGEGKTLKNMLGVRSERDKEDSRAAAALKLQPYAAGRAPVVVTRGKPEFEKSYKPPRAGAPKRRLKLGVFYSPEQIAGEGFFDAVFLPLDKFERGLANGVALPPVAFDIELKSLKQKIEAAKAAGAEFVLVENIGQLPLAEGFYGIGGVRLNITNTPAAEFYMRNLSGVILSPELNLAQIRDIGCADKGALVYGRLPLMTFARRLGGGATALRDRTGTVFPVLPFGERDILYNSVPVYMADKADALTAAGIAIELYNFTTETEAEVEKIVNAYRRGLPYPTQNIRRIK